MINNSDAFDDSHKTMTPPEQEMNSQPTSNPRKPPKVRQACDCCHARKIRCDGTMPCANCKTTALPCTYLAVPKKKGPKGPSSRTPRAVLKMQMRQEQNGRAESLLADVRPRSSPTESSRSQDRKSYTTSFPQEPWSRQFTPSVLVSRSLVELHVDSFFKHKYPVTPILHRDRFYESLDSFQTSPETYSLVTSLCAAVISQTQPDTTPVSTPSSSVADPTCTPEFFIYEAKRARQYHEYIEKPSLADAQTSFFLFAALFNADRHNSAWFVLREAMTMVQMLRLHEEETYMAMEDEVEKLFSRRTFWLLFITERAYALQRHRPLTLQRTIDLPTVSPSDSDAAIISGFLDLVSLFQNFDDNFVSLWNVSSRTASLPYSSPEAVTASATHLSALQTILATSIPDVGKRTEVQQADLLISRQWLKTMVWQLCVTKGLLSSSSRDESMSLGFPVSIARDVVSASRILGREAFEPHGPGILEKVFDIGCSLADVLQCHPNSPQVNIPNIDFGPRDYLMEMLKLMSTVFGGSSRYLNMLALKAEECLRTPPRNALEYGDDQSQNGRIVDIEEDQPLPVLTDPDYEYLPFSTNNPVMFDFGALSAASVAWLGSMDDVQFCEMEELPQDSPYSV